MDSSGILRPKQIKAIYEEEILNRPLISNEIESGKIRCWILSKFQERSYANCAWHIQQNWIENKRKLLNSFYEYFDTKFW